MAQDKQFLVTQKAFIENEKGELLVLNDPYLGIDLPGGKVQEGETDLVESLKREVKEETGLDIKVDKAIMAWIFEYPEGFHKSGQIFSVGYKCKIDSDSVTISDEHDAYYWVTKDSYKTLKENNKRRYSKVLENYFNLRKTL